jgi:hypothetical protein
LDELLSEVFGDKVLHRQLNFITPQASQYAQPLQRSYNRHGAWKSLPVRLGRVEYILPSIDMGRKLLWQSPEKGKTGHLSQIVPYILL